MTSEHDEDTPWLILVGSDAEVHGVDGAPAEWIGQRLDTLAAAPSTLRTAARSLVAEGHGHVEPLLTRAIPAAVDHPRVTLVMSQSVPVRRRETELRVLFQHALSALGRQAAALEVDLRLEVAPRVPTHAVVDPEKLAWIVSSLIGNSLRHVKRGTRSLPGGSVVVQVGFDRASSMLRVEVSDDGPGIAKEIAANLFRRSVDSPQALGLALTLVRDVVTAHGGALHLETSTDAADHGTTVTLRVPILGPPPSSRPGPPSSAPASAKSSISGRSE